MNRTDKTACYSKQLDYCSSKNSYVADPILRSVYSQLYRPTFETQVFVWFVHASRNCSKFHVCKLKDSLAYRERTLVGPCLVGKRDV